MKEIFDNYVKKYDIDDQKIKGKWEHSYRVMEKAIMLAKKLKLSEEDIYLAEVIGLLHDIGRFEQWTKFKTFVDLKSIDHGDYGCKLLFEDGFIEDFKIDSKYYKIIEKAIRNHNKPNIEEGLTEQELLQAKIIRDADKLDILYISAFLGSISYSYSDEPVSKKIEETFWNHGVVYTKDIENANDFVMRTLCFLFDFNYVESLHYMKENDYLEEFEKKLNHPLFRPYFEELKQYIEKRI